MDMEAFSNRRSNYHVTLFHTSHPSDPRPDAMAASGGVDLATAASKRPGPSQVLCRQLLWCLSGTSHPLIATALYMYAEPLG